MVPAQGAHVPGAIETLQIRGHPSCSSWVSEGHLGLKDAEDSSGDPRHGREHYLGTGRILAVLPFIPQCPNVTGGDHALFGSLCL